MVVETWTPEAETAWAEWSVEMRTRPWVEDRASQVWAVGGGDTVKRFKDGLWPMTVVTLATRPGSEEATRVWIDERWETWVRWSVEAGVSGEDCESTTSDTAEATQVEDERTGRAAGGWMVGRAEADERRDRRTTYPGKKDLMGFHQPKWERDRVMAGLCEEAGRMKQGGGRAILLTYSDASLKNGIATYAWMVGGAARRG